MTATVSDLLADLRDRIAALPDTQGRHMVAIAAPPGAGKSTLAQALAEDLGARAALVPMDGFHLDNVLLDARGLRPRKGAPETFDAAGFVVAMDRLRAGGEVILPVFDRARDLAVAGAIAVGTDVRIAIVEGNYLLFDEPPWRALDALWDVRVWIEVPEAELRRRLVQRWVDHGHDQAAAEARAETNDLANARRIAAARLRADVTLA